MENAVVEEVRDDHLLRRYELCPARLAETIDDRYRERVLRRREEEKMARGIDLPVYFELDGLERLVADGAQGGAPASIDRRLEGTAIASGRGRGAAGLDVDGRPALQSPVDASRRSLPAVTGRPWR